MAVLRLIEERLEQLAAGAQPSGGRQDRVPEHAGPAAGGSPANPARSREDNQPVRNAQYDQTPNRSSR